VVRTILNNGMSIRKALTYSGCSKNMYYNNNNSRKNNYRNHIASLSIEENIQQISLQRPTYGTRRMAAMLTRILGRPVNRKRVQRESSERWATLHHQEVRRKSFVQKYPL
jgi:hypothetical protein